MRNDSKQKSYHCEGVRACVKKFLPMQYIGKDTSMENKLPEYEMPKVTTYTDDEILEVLGPVQTGHVKDSAF